MSDMLPYPIERTVCWFSCGAASAVACKLALDKFENCVIVYQDTGSEHPDSRRFLRDCEEWYDKPITIIKSDSYTDIWDVFKQTNYLAGIGGARCTGELKRKVAELFINHCQDREVFPKRVLPPPITSQGDSGSQRCRPPRKKGWPRFPARGR